MVNTSYENIWFIEDDVFFFNEQTIVNIDNKYLDGDLLSNTVTQHCSHYIGTPTYDWGWWWHLIHIDLSLPYYRGMVCAVRMSKMLLSKIVAYVEKYNTFFFLEAMFPTLCDKNQLIHHIPEELSFIIFRRDYSVEEIDSIHLYHPVKDISLHEFYRSEIIKNTINNIDIIIDTDTNTNDNNINNM